MGFTHYVVSPTNINDLAKAFDGFKTEITTVTNELTKIEIKAGKFTDADNLESHVETRTTELKTNLEGLAGALGEISTKLTTIANKYTKTEDQNKLTAKDLEDLIDGVEKYLPGFE